MIISMCAGEFVHVDLMPINDNAPEHSVVCTSYIGENFSLSLATKQAYNDKDCVALCIELTEEEHQKLTSYLLALADHNIPYNYQDVLVSALPRSVSRVLVDDVADERPEKISTLFCSQAVVLALRNSLDGSHPLMHTLQQVNSRCTLPDTLFRLLEPGCQRLSCQALRSGVASAIITTPPAS